MQLKSLPIRAANLVLWNIVKSFTVAVIIVRDANNAIENNIVDFWLLILKKYRKGFRKSLIINLSGLVTNDKKGTEAAKVSISEILPKSIKNIKK